MNEKKVIYAIYVPASPERTILDAIRLFANPQAKHAAHVTVRGPYDDYQDPRDWSAQVKGHVINVGGVDTFPDDGDEKILFLRVDSPAVRAVWHKPDYPDEYNPHLTIYRGKKESLAARLLNLLKENNPRITFRATGVEPIVLGNGPRPLRAWYDPAELKGFMAQPPTPSELQDADDTSRLSWIRELIAHLMSGHAKTSLRGATV
jgi:hypothetical protein